MDLSPVDTPTTAPTWWPPLLRTVVTEAADRSHLRRGAVDRRPDETSERNRTEIVNAMDRRRRSGRRVRAGSSPIASTGAHRANARARSR